MMLSAVNRCSEATPCRSGWGLAALIACASVAITLTPSARGGAADPANEFAIEVWMTERGLPQNSITALLQTRRGYIWASTYNGIAQFDGERFRIFDSSNTKGLPNSRVTVLFEDAQGDIWIGHDTGDVTRCVQGRFEPVVLAPQWGRSAIHGIRADRAGDVWVLNLRGVALRVRDGRIVPPPPELAEEPVVAPQFVLDAQQRLLIVRNGYIAELTPDGCRRLELADAGTRPYYPRIAPAQAGGFWSPGGGRVQRWDGQAWRDDLGAYPWGEAFVMAMLESTTGQLLVGTLERGVFIYDRALGWMNLNRTNGLPQDWIRAVIEDREQNIWLGTSGGLTVLRPRKVVMHGPPDDWHGRPVQAIARARDGAVWAAPEGAGVYRLLENNWTRFDNSAGLSNLFAWSVLADRTGKIWAGTWGGGLFRWEGNNFVRQFDIAERGEPVTALMDAPDGTLWIGTAAGLLRADAGKLERLARLGGAAAGDVRVLAPGRAGELWIGTQGSGLGRLQEGRLHTFTSAQGLPRDFILSLYQEADRTLWIGTLDRGVARLREGKFSSITTEQGLPNNVIGHIEDDQMGHLWFSSQKGIFRISKNDLNRCANDPTNKLAALVLGKAEGLATLAGSSGFTPSGFRAPDGRLWFPTTRGIAVVNPRAVRTNEVPPSVWVEDVLVDGLRTEIQTRPGASGRRFVELKPGRRQLEINFTGISLTSPERVQFRYRLDRADANWTESASRGPVTYSFLPPGEYTFHVIACNSDGLWNEAGDALDIIVQPHFWQTWWFKTGVVAAGLAAVGGGVWLESRRRLRRKLERIARERELERERARIAQDIHDDLGASLTRIGMLSESATDDLDDRDRAAASLGQIYSTARDLTRAMDEIVWAVNPRHDTLESLTNYVARFAQDFLSAAQIRCRLDTPTRVPELAVRSEIRHNLFLAFKETLNNAVKHSGATEVQVRIELVADGFKLVVADNGMGFTAPRSTATGTSGRVVSGYGLENIRKRLDQIGGRMELDNQPGRGVRVELLVPLPELNFEPVTGNGRGPAGGPG